MNYLMSIFLSIIMLFGWGWHSGWGDLFHLACGALIAGLISVGWTILVISRRRAANEFAASDQIGGSPLRALVVGLAVAGTHVALFQFGYAKMERLPLFDGLVEPQRQEFETRLTAIRSVGDHPSAIALLQKRLTLNISGQRKRELAGLLYDEQVAAAKRDERPQDRLVNLDHAIATGQKYDLDTGVADGLKSEAIRQQDLLDRLTLAASRKDWSELATQAQVALNERHPDWLVHRLAQLLYDALLRQAEAANDTQAAQFLDEAVRIAGAHGLSPAVAIAMQQQGSQARFARSQFAQRIEQYRQQKQWTRIEILLRETIQTSRRSEWPDPAVDRWLIEAVMRQAENLTDLHDKRDKYNQALATAQQLGLDSPEAQAQIKLIDANLDRTRQFQLRTEDLRRAGRWQELAALLTVTMQSEKSDWPMNHLDQLLFESIMQWGDSDLDPESQIKAYQQAMQVASQYSLDGSSAATAMEEVQARLTLATQPVALPNGTTAGMIETSFKNPFVFVDFWVENSRGELIRKLAAKDVQVRYGGRTIPVAQIEPVKEDEAPLNVALVLDISGSTQGKPLEQALQGAMRFLDRLASRRKNVRVMVIVFNSKARILVPWTSDLAKASGALRSVSASGETAIFSALDMATSELARQEGDRRILLFTDGFNTVKSSATLEQIVSAGKVNKVQIHSIGLNTQGGVDAKMLRTLANGSSGTYFEADSAESLVGLYETMARRVHQGYYRLVLNTAPAQGEPAPAALSLTIGGANSIVLNVPLPVKETTQVTVSAK